MNHFVCSVEKKEISFPHLRFYAIIHQHNGHVACNKLFEPSKQDTTARCSVLYYTVEGAMTNSKCKGGQKERKREDVSRAPLSVILVGLKCVICGVKVNYTLQL